jgi:hypothetical protein
MVLSGRKPCKAGWARSRSTKKCRKKSCGSGRTRDKVTQKCRSKKRSGAKKSSGVSRRKSVKVSRKPCKAGWARSRSTKKCRKKSCGSGRTRDKVTQKCRSKRKTGPKKNKVLIATQSGHNCINCGAVNSVHINSDGFNTCHNCGYIPSSIGIEYNEPKRVDDKQAFFQAFSQSVTKPSLDELIDEAIKETQEAENLIELLKRHVPMTNGEDVDIQNRIARLSIKKDRIEDLIQQMQGVDLDPDDIDALANQLKTLKV